MRSLIYILLLSLFLTPLLYSAEAEDICAGNCVSWYYYWNDDPCWDTFSAFCQLSKEELMVELGSFALATLSGEASLDTLQTALGCAMLAETCVNPRIEGCINECSQNPSIYLPDLVVFGDEYADIPNFPSLRYSDGYIFASVENWGLAWSTGTDVEIYAGSSDKPKMPTEWKLLYRGMLPNLVPKGAFRVPQDAHQYLNETVGVPPYRWEGFVRYEPDEDKYNVVKIVVNHYNRFPEISTDNNVAYLILDYLPTPPSLRGNHSFYRDGYFTNRYEVTIHAENQGGTEDHVTAYLYFGDTKKTIYSWTFKLNPGRDWETDYTFDIPYTHHDSVPVCVRLEGENSGIFYDQCDNLQDPWAEVTFTVYDDQFEELVPNITIETPFGNCTGEFGSCKIPFNFRDEITAKVYSPQYIPKEFTFKVPEDDCPDSITLNLTRKTTHIYVSTLTPARYMVIGHPYRIPSHEDLWGPVKYSGTVYNGDEISFPMMPAEIYVFAPLCKMQYFNYSNVKYADQFINLTCLDYTPKPLKPSSKLKRVATLKPHCNDCSLWTAKFNKRGDKLFALYTEGDHCLLKIFDLNSAREIDSVGFGCRASDYKKLSVDIFGDRALITLNGHPLLYSEDHIQPLDYYSQRDWSIYNYISGMGDLLPMGYYPDYNLSIMDYLDTVYPEIVLLDGRIAGPCKNEGGYCVTFPGDNTTYPTGGIWMVSAYLPIDGVITDDNWLYIYDNGSLKSKIPDVDAGDLVDISPDGGTVIIYKIGGPNGQSIRVYDVDYPEKPAVFIRYIYNIDAVGATESGLYITSSEDRKHIDVYVLGSRFTPTSRLVSTGSESPESLFDRIINFIWNFLKKLFGF